MRNQATPFRHDLEALNGELNTLNSRKVELKVEMTKAKNELASAKKAFTECNDAANQLRLANAEADYGNIQDQLGLVSKQAKQTQKDMLEAGDAISKADNRAASRTASGGAGAEAAGGLLSQLGQAGLFSMAGDTLSGIANTLASSTYGEEIGTLFSSALSSAGSGAAIGTMIAPGIGTAIGGAIGAGVGLLNGATQNFQKEDEGFKSYYKDLYGTVTDDRASMTASGSAIAGQREIDRGAFSKLLGGEEEANTYLDQVQDMANRTPFLYSD